MNRDKLLKYLADEEDLSAAEKEEIRETMQRRPEFRRRSEGTPSDWDVQQAKQKLFAAIDDDAPLRRSDPPAPSSRRDRLPLRPVRKGRRPLVPMLAAAVVALLGMFALYQSTWFAPAEEPALVEREFATIKGQRSGFTLAPGLEMHLNVDSRIGVIHNPETSEWDIHLEGEGYFAFEPGGWDAIRVHAGDVNLRVIGTEFSVRFFPEDEAVEVVVVKGKVEVPTLENLVELSDGSVGLFAEGHTRAINRFSPDELRTLLSWRDGRLVFANTPLRMAIPMIERWYDVSVELEADGFDARQIYGVFEDENIQDVLDVLSMSLGLKYRLEQDVFVLYSE